jgi:hypothetical protein
LRFSTNGVCNLQQNTNAVPRRSRRFHDDAGVLHGDLVTIQRVILALFYHLKSGQTVYFEDLF